MWPALVPRGKTKPLRGSRRVLNAVGWTLSIVMVTAVVGVLLDAVIVTAGIAAWIVSLYLVNKRLGPRWWRGTAGPPPETQSTDASRRRKGNRDVKG